MKGNGIATLAIVGIGAALLFSHFGPAGVLLLGAVLLCLGK